MARCRWPPGGRRDRSEGAPETIDADPVTGERLAPGLPCSEAARVTSERKRGSDAGGGSRKGARRRQDFAVTGQ